MIGYRQPCICDKKKKNTLQLQKVENSLEVSDRAIFVLEFLMYEWPKAKYALTDDNVATKQSNPNDYLPLIRSVAIFVEILGSFTKVLLRLESRGHDLKRAVLLLQQQSFFIPMGQLTSAKGMYLSSKQITNT